MRRYLRQWGRYLIARWWYRHIDGLDPELATAGDRSFILLGRPGGWRRPLEIEVDRDQLAVLAEMILDAEMTETDHIEALRTALESVPLRPTWTSSSPATGGLHQSLAHELYARGIRALPSYNDEDDDDA